MVVMEICPRCAANEIIEPRYSTSRRDNRTRICPECGESEAIVDLLRSLGADIPVYLEAREKTLALYIQRRKGGAR
jgi:hypothetical protein